MKKLQILCPVDFSAVSQTAAHAAAALSRRSGGSLELLHVLSEPESGSADDESLRRGAEARLAECAAALPGGVAAVSSRVVRVRSGERLRSAVIRRIRESGADLLVVSTGGGSGGGGWLIGSMAASLVQESPVPVLVVRDAATLVTWAEGAAGPLDVTVALELDDSGRQLLEAVSALGFAENTKLSAVHVRRITAMPAGLSEPMLYSDPAVMAVISEEEAVGALRLLLDETLPGVTASVHADALGAEPSGILAGMADSGEGLLVTGSHHRGAVERFLLGSVSNAVLRNVRTNVLCIPVVDRPVPVPADSVTDPAPVPDSSPASVPQPVLCATDFSWLGDDAVQAGRALAFRLGLPWQLVHALEPSHLPPEDPSSMLLHEGAEARLRRMARNEPVMPESVKVIHRPVGETIVHALTAQVSAVNAAVLAVSTHGRSGSVWWPLGSTSIALAESVGCPVLVATDAEPLRRWADRQRNIGILAGIDPSENQSAVFTWLRKLAAAGGCRIVLAAVVPPVATVVTDAIAMPDLSENEPVAKSRLHELAALHLPETPVECTALRGTTADALVTAAREFECDLIVLGTHHRQGFSRLLHGSVSRRVLGNSPCSVLCVPLEKS